EECDGAFGVECVFDDEPKAINPITHSSASDISSDSDLDTSEQRSASTAVTSPSESLGSMPGLQTVSSSSRSNGSIYDDDVQVDSDINWEQDLFSDLGDDVSNPNDLEDVDWSA